MKTTTLFVAAPFLVAGWASLLTPSPHLIAPESRMWIDGTSNVHDWTCEVGTVEGFVETDESWGLVAAEIWVPISEIECKNGKMNKKLQDALKAEDHPVISFILDSTRVAEGSTSVDIELIASGRVTLAGVTNAIGMTVLATPLPEGGYRLTGELPILMKDYDVKPPKALMGLIKTGKEVTVRFEIVVARPQT